MKSNLFILSKKKKKNIENEHFDTVYIYIISY